MSDDIRPMKVEIHAINREYDGFFKVDKLTTSHERYVGGMKKFDWLVFERGNAVAVVLYKSDSKEIILVRQFRAPTLKYRRIGDAYTTSSDGQLDETIAGMPRDGETNEDCAIREVWEETRYIIKPRDLELISQFYASPGGTSERIFLYYAVVTDASRDPKFDQKTAGVADEAEDIKVRHIPVSTFFSTMLTPTEAIDSKVLIASMLLRDRIGKIPTAQTQPAPIGQRLYGIKASPDHSIALRTGNMLQVTDVDAWVNTENTDMEMDRFIGTSVSALIRYAGAALDEQNRVVEDTVADALKSKMRGRGYSRIGTVHDTTSGRLYQTHNVKRLFHVAAVEGVVGKGAFMDAAQIESVTLKSLEAIDRRNESFLSRTCRSALLPMFGAGESGLATEIAFPEILKGILSYFRANKRSTLKAVHVCAYRQHDADVALQYLNEHPELVFSN